MIRIQNIYYMLSYAYQALQNQGYASLANEEFTNTADLLSAILVKGVSLQIKKGLGKDYMESNELLGFIRGKIDIQESTRQRLNGKIKISCSYDNFCIDTYPNRIINTTLHYLLKLDIPKSRKKEIRNLLLYFKDVQVLNYSDINWDLHYTRNNQSYQMMISICYLIIHDLLQNKNNENCKCKLDTCTVEISKSERRE